MITQLNGKLIEVAPTHLVMDCNGVGYWVNISLHTHQTIEQEQPTTIYTHLAVREDAHVLYGFATKQERQVFLHLISVSGVGPSSAMMMLSTLSIQEIVSAIGASDYNTLQSVKGIGTKTAQRVVIDLKDKMQFDTANQVEFFASSENKTKIDTLSALEVLGIPRKIAEKKLDAIIASNPKLTTEQLVKEILKKI